MRVRIADDVREQTQEGGVTRAGEWRDAPVVAVGGDKPVPYFDLPGEANPFLGYRGVRLYPEHRAVFLAQLRAIVRSSAFGNVQIMLPMISSPDEVRWVKERLVEVRAELASAGIAHDPAQKLGVMIEVPSAAFLIDQLASEVD